jgi:phage/plasmid-like protein (TIGR03299 family)
MAYYGDPPWHGLGRELPECATADEMIRAAGVDWQVEKCPLEGPYYTMNADPSRFSLVRKAGNEKEQDVLLGLVGKDYVPLQNTDAFKFFDPIVESKAAIFHTAGALGVGERVWVLAKLPGNIRVIGNDIVDKYLLLSNNHSGKESVTIKFTPIRVVCQNTLNFALQDGNQSVRVRHTGDLHKRLSEVPEMLGIINETYAKAGALFSEFASIRFGTVRFDQYLEGVFPRTERQKSEKKRPERWDRVTALFEKGDPGINEGRGTLWAAYNAVIRDEDYRHSTERGPDRRLSRVWFGAGADLKYRALRVAQEFARKSPLTDRTNVGINR